MKKMKSNTFSKKNMDKWIHAKGLYKVEEDEKTKKQILVNDLEEIGRELSGILPPKPRNWKNKKQMKAFKKLRTKFLKFGEEQ